MDVKEKDFKIESLLADLDLEQELQLELEVTTIDFNVKAIPKLLNELISYCHKVSFIFLALNMSMFDNKHR